MKKLSRLVAVALASLLVLSGGQVFADEGEDALLEEGDTTFNLAYDPEHQVLLWNLAMSDGPYDCSLNQAGSLRATYGVSLDGVVPVTDLRLETGDPVTFPNRPAEELGEGVETATEPVDYAGPDGDCGLNGAEVGGPQGQVNHGAFMSLFNSLWDGPGRGCVNRYLAQSDFGKGDQQVKAGDDDAAAVPEPVSDEPVEGTVDFLTFAADCERGNAEGGPGNGNGNGNGNGHGNGNGNGHDKSDPPGNSGNAPGHNK